MKKIILIIIILVLTAGCTNINKLSYDDIVNNITTMSTKDNIYRTGYSYYLPRGMKVADSTLYNEVIEDANSKYYLYVDVVSFYKKITKEYEINNNAIYSSKINYNDKFGYVEVNLLKNDKYLVEIMYNYAKIEVMVDYDDINLAVLNAVTILRDLEYNDMTIESIASNKSQKFNDETYNIFNPKGNDNNYLDIIQNEDDTNAEENEEIDTDLVK